MEIVLQFKSDSLEEFRDFITGTHYSSDLEDIKRLIKVMAMTQEELNAQATRIEEVTTKILESNDEFKAAVEAEMEQVRQFMATMPKKLDGSALERVVANLEAAVAQSDENDERVAMVFQQPTEENTEEGGDMGEQTSDDAPSGADPNATTDTNPMPNDGGSVPTGTGETGTDEGTTGTGTDAGSTETANNGGADASTGAETAGGTESTSEGETATAEESTGSQGTVEETAPTPSGEDSGETDSSNEVPADSGTAGTVDGGATTGTETGPGAMPEVGGDADSTSTDNTSTDTEGEAPVGPVGEPTTTPTSGDEVTGATTSADENGVPTVLPSSR